MFIVEQWKFSKTVQFGKYSYIGDPLNTCRDFQ